MEEIDLSDFLNPARTIRTAKIHDSMKVADFGIGGGFFARAAARAVGSSGKVYAIDINRELLKRLKTFAIPEMLTNIEYVRGDLELTHGSALPDASVDVVLIANLLFQVEAKDKVIEEAWRILRSGGRLILIDWQESFNNVGPHKDHVFKREAALELATHGGGFEYMQEIPSGSFHYGLILKKTKTQ